MDRSMDGEHGVKYTVSRVNGRTGVAMRGCQVIRGFDSERWVRE